MRRRRWLFSTFFRWLWFFAVLCSLVTGLAHLPLGWHSSGPVALVFPRPLLDRPALCHYWAGALLLFLLAYAAVVWMVAGRKEYRLTAFGYSRLALLFLLCLSGLLLMLHNLADFSLYGALYPCVKLLHLAAALCFLPLVLVRLARQGKWLRRRAGGGEFSPYGGMRVMPR